MRALAVVTVVAAALPAAGCGGSGGGIHKIRHIVVIMQENRSFDSYFGTYPGADGIPAGVCLPDPLHGGCVHPFHDRADVNYGGPHHAIAFYNDFRKGSMSGFVREAELALKCHGNATRAGCSPCATAGRARACVDVMGYHDGADIPNYWTYARDFVLQDHMFEPVRSWSWAAHLYQVSAWSAKCANNADAMTCRTFYNQLATGRPDVSEVPWTDITYLLHKHHVSWGYYVFKGSEPDCEDDSAMTCAPVPQDPRTPGIWNPLPYFDTVRQDGQLGDVRSLSSFFAEAKAGTLPAVSWIAPSAQVSEHPPALVSAGQTYVTGLINATMKSPDWDSTAIFLAWDDWGGFYDHLQPPTIPGELEQFKPESPAGYGFRVPALVISPYARRGLIDHQILSFDAYLKFIEDDFLGGQRLDPKTDGRPDPRPDVRENEKLLGNLIADFNFSQSPQPPVLLPVQPATDLLAPSPAPSPRPQHRHRRQRHR